MRWWSLHYCMCAMCSNSITKERIYYREMSEPFISFGGQHKHHFVAMLCAVPLHPKLITFPVKISRRSRVWCCSSSMGKEKLMEFPHLCEPHKDVMVRLITALEKEHHSHLLPCLVPPDLKFYQNDTASNQGTLHIRSGLPSSHINFVLASWLHLKTPNGGALNITNLQGYLKSTTDAPNFQFELVQCSPEFYILFVDIIPRKDLVLHPDYLKTFYEDNKLELLRQKLDQVPEINPYFSSSLYFRGVVSPTGILVSIKCEGAERAEEILRDHVVDVADEVMRIWLEKCVVGEREVGEEERIVMEKRDRLIKNKAIEMDLSASMPLQFGQELADRFLGVIRGVFNS